MANEHENLSWQAFGDASRQLAETIAADGFRPDIILAIARGGMFIAGALGYALSVKNLHLVNVEFYTGEGTTLDMPVMLPPVPQAVDFSAKKVLIADDVADSGKTLELIHSFVREQVEEARTAVIYEKPRSLVRCDYVWRHTDRWIDFPWSSDPPVALPSQFATAETSPWPRVPPTAGRASGPRRPRRRSATSGALP